MCKSYVQFRAYQELLYNLVDMEGSPNPDIKEAGRVLKASVFYEPEYRELCLQQLSSYNPDRMSRDYLTDLVSTTHVFLKLMEHMSKNKHLIVSKKTKKKVKKSTKKSGQTAAGPGNTDGRELNEQRWESISSQLSAILQGRGDTELPTDVIPFDAASDESMEEQKVTCMRNIQRALRDKEPARAVALMRAAREVWPDGDNFGEAGAEPEEEFMALREVLFAELGAEDSGGQADDNTETGEIGEEMDEEEEDEEEEQVKTYSVEQEFNYKAFVFRFAVKNVVMPYGVLFNSYLKNSKETNHHIIKMFHRIAVDCELPALLFQTSIFRVFQQVWRDLKMNPKDQSLRELAKFAKFILAKFLTVAASNKKVFIELFFWKTSKEATEIIEGYGTQTNSNKAKAAFWSSEEEERLTSVFGQVMEMEKSGDNNDREGDVLDQIELMFRCDNRSRRQIGNKLRELGLIQNMREITKKPLKSSRSWQEEEMDKLKELFEEFKTAENPGARIHEQWKAAAMPVRSKNKLCDKIVEMGWVEDRTKLGRAKKRNRRAKEGEAGFLNTKSDSDSALDSSSEEEAEESGPEEQTSSTSAPVLSVKEALQRLEGEEERTMKWLSDTLLEESKDRSEDFDGEDVPLVTVDADIQAALSKSSVTDLLSSLGLCPPSQGEQFWRIPGDMTVERLEVRATVLGKASSGVELESVFEDVNMELLAVARGFEAMKTVKTKKKEKRNKWLPFRRPAEENPTDIEPKVKTPKSTKKAKNKSFLESSDDEAENRDDPENNENVDPQNKENVPSAKNKSKKDDPKPAGKSLDMVKKMDMAKLKKLLEDDSFTGSDVSESDEKEVHSSGDQDAKVKKKAPKKKAVKKKTAVKKSKKNDEDANSSDEEEEVIPKKKSPPKKKPTKQKSLASSSDEGVIDPTQPSNERIRAESSADDTVPTDANIPKKRINSIESSSDEGVDDPTQPSIHRIKAVTTEEDTDASVTSKLSRTTKNTTLDSSDEEHEISTKQIASKKLVDSDSDDGKRSPSVSSRSSINDSRQSLDDSRAKSPTQWVLTPVKGSPNDSRMSRKSSFDSTIRSPLSSPLSSPSTPARNMQSPIVKSTPAMKRLRSNDTPGSAEKANKKSRLMSPNQSLNLQLSDSSEQHEDDSPVKKPTKKKVFIESDSD